MALQRAIEPLNYFSIDIEGGELAVLSTFPFDRFEIGAWSVEVNAASSQIARSCPSSTTANMDRPGSLLTRSRK
jgi:hypothetical protein